MRKFTVNGKEYTAVEQLDYLFMIHLDDSGANADNILGVSAINAFFTFCSGLSKKKAADEITAHVINNNGQFPEELLNVYKELIEESGFFRALSGDGQQSEEATETTEPTETPKKKTTKKASE